MTYLPPSPAAHAAQPDHQVEWSAAPATATHTSESHTRLARVRSRLAAALAMITGVTVLATLLLPGLAAAHRLDESYIYVDVYEREVEGRLEFNVTEINAALDLGISTEDAELAEAQLVESFDTIIEYAQPRFGLGAGGQEWDLGFVPEIEVLDTESGIFGVFPFEVLEVFSETPLDLDVRYEVFFDAVEDHVALFHIGNYWEGGVFANESDSLNFLSPFTINNRTETFDLDEPDFWRGFRGTVDLGVEHIRIGTDHILFVVVLLLPSVLVFSAARSWEPSTGFLSALWRVLKIATAFTVAHSITLTMAGLGWFELPSKLVETIIALSIIIAALHNLRPVVVNREWVIAFGFGLFHGLGFAGLLSDLGLDRTNRVWSLVGFNLGVEIGQVAIILLIFPTLYVLRRTKLFDIGFRVASVGIAFVALLWMFERIFEVDLRVSSLIDPFVKVPRAYVLAVLAFVLAVAWREFEARRGMLRTNGESDDDGLGGTPPERELVDA